MKKTTSIGIPIQRESFRALVIEYLKRCNAGEEMQPEDYVTMTRLWNTIEAYHLNQADELYQQFWTAFFPAYVEKASKALGALPTKGMALYSKQYDLYLGGKPHTNSQYSLEDK